MAMAPSPLDDEITALENERVRIEKRIQEINDALAEKYRAWHADRFARRAGK